MFRGSIAVNVKVHVLSRLAWPQLLNPPTRERLHQVHLPIYTHHNICLSSPVLSRAVCCPPPPPSLLHCYRKHSFLEFSLPDLAHSTLLHPAAFWVYWHCYKLSTKFTLNLQPTTLPCNHLQLARVVIARPFCIADFLQLRPVP